MRNGPGEAVQNASFFEFVVMAVLDAGLRWTCTGSTMGIYNPSPRQ